MAGWVHMNTTAKYVKIELNAYFRCAESPWLLQSWTQRHIAWHRKTFDHTFLMRSPNGKLMDAHIFNFPSKTSIYNGFSIAMLNNQMLFPKLSQQVTTSQTAVEWSLRCWFHGTYGTCERLGLECQAYRVRSPQWLKSKSPSTSLFSHRRNETLCIWRFFRVFRGQH